MKFIEFEKDKKILQKQKEIDDLLYEMQKATDTFYQQNNLAWKRMELQKQEMDDVMRQTAFNDLSNQSKFHKVFTEIASKIPLRKIKVVNTGKNDSAQAIVEQLKHLWYSEKSL